MTGKYQDLPTRPYELVGFELQNQKVKVYTVKLIGTNQLFSISHYNEDSPVSSAYCNFLIKSISDI